MFNKQAVNGNRCAAEIAYRLEAVVATVGLPTFFVGGALLTVGMFLAGYDHL